MATKKVRKKRKITRAQHEVELIRARRNPEFRRQERFNRLTGNFALEYLRKIVDGEEIAPLVEKNTESLEEIGGLETVHGFLLYLEAIEPDWADFLGEDGYLKIGALTEDGYKFVDQHKKEIAEGLVEAQ